MGKELVVLMESVRYG